MGKTSVPRGRGKHDGEARPSTREITADVAFCGMLAEDLGIEPAAARQAFIGEPKVRCIRVVEWAMRHEPDDPGKRSRMVVAWAKKRAAGVYRHREDAEREVALAVARYWTEHPERLVELLKEALQKTGKCSGCGERFLSRELVEVDEENQDGMHPPGTLLCAPCAGRMGVER